MNSINWNALAVAFGFMTVLLSMAAVIAVTEGNAAKRYLVPVLVAVALCLIVSASQSTGCNGPGTVLTTKATKGE